MGLDYIRAQTGKPWRKRWNGGLDRLKAPTLLDLTVTEAARTVTAELNAGARVKAGDKLIVQSASDGLTISDGLRAIGRINNPSTELSTAIREGGGYAEGVLQRVGLYGDAAELSVKGTAGRPTSLRVTSRSRSGSGTMRHVTRNHWGVQPVSSA